MPTPRFRTLAAARLATSEIISPAVSALFDGEGGASAIATRQVPVARLTPMPGQPHQPFNPADLSALAQSIAEHGVLEPILVRPIGSGAGCAPSSCSCCSLLVWPRPTTMGWSRPPDSLCSTRRPA